MNEQLINDRIRLDNINSEMARISNVAREYMNASQEQRDRVDPQLLASVLDRYNMLRADKLALEQSVVAREMEAQRQAQQVQAQPANTYKTRRRIVNNNVPTFTPVENQWWLNRPGAIAFDANGMYVMNDDWTITTTPNTVEDWGVNQSYYPWMSMRTDIPTQETNNTPIYRNWRNNLPNYWVTPWMPDWNVQTWYMTPVGTQTQTSAVEQRNAMPWYKQMVTPYSEEYLREIWAISDNKSNTSTNTSNNNVGPYTAERNNMPWYRQMVTPYSEGYLREQWYL